MNMIKNALLTFSIFLFTRVAFAALPSFANGGDLSSQLESKGEAITDAVTLVAAIVGVVAIAGSAIYFSSGNADRGKQFLTGGLIGIFIAGAVYGIAGVVG